MAVRISYDDFVSLIESMVQHKESGTLYIRTDANRSVIVGIQKGNIKAFISGAKHGLEAITMILQMSYGSCRRADTVLSFHSKDLPSTSDILLLLKKRSPPSTVGESPRPPSSPSSQIDSVLAGQILCELLHDYVGPVAPIICDDITDNGAKIHTREDLESAIGNLANEIDSSVEAEEFINRARENLRAILS